MISNTCQSLLDQGLEFHPLYGDRLANHLPMALIALDGLGADTVQLEKFYLHYSPRLKPLGEAGPQSALLEDVDTQLGQRSSFWAYLDYFQANISAKGYRQVLSQTLPILMPGVAASAFHALIRLAYAVEAEHETEMAYALAYWATEFQSFDVSQKVVNESLTDIMKRLSPHTQQYDFAPGIIVDRLTEVEVLLKKQNLPLQPTELKLGQITEFCLNAYARKKDFTLLHTVTSCHAFRLLLPFIKDEQPALRYLWQGIVLAYMSTGLSFDDTHVDIPEVGLSWDEITHKACGASNDHVIKLIYTSSQQNKYYHQPIYRYIASRVLASAVV